MEMKKLIFGNIYPLYVKKVEKKGRAKEEVDLLISKLTGYSVTELEELVATQMDFEAFFTKAPNLNPKRESISGSICGVKINEIEDHITKEIRRLDKLVDELAKGKSIDKILG